MEPIGLLEGRSLLVAGATQGLGAAIAQEAARQGARSITVTGRNAERGRTTVARLQALGTEAQYFRADLAETGNALNAVRAAIGFSGTLDCVVNSAGTTARGSLLDTDEKLLDRHLAVNLKAPFFVMQEAINHMMENQISGNILNIITLSSHGGQPFLTPYVASKAGLGGLTKNVAFSHVKDRIRVNGLNIGWTATDGENAMQIENDGSGTDWLSKASAAAPLGKLGQVDEIAEFVVFLISPRSGVVTGSLIDWDQQIIGAYA